MPESTRRRRKKATTEQVKGRVTVNTRVVKEQEEIHVFTDDMHEIDVQEFEVEPAFIRIGAGVTKKLRDYESLRVDVAATIPCYVEDMDEAKKALSDWVSETLFDEVDQYYEDPNGG